MFVVRVVYGQYIIDAQVGGIEPIYWVFLSRLVHKLYEFRFVWIWKDVGEKRDAICTDWNADGLLKDHSGKNHKDVVT